MTASDPIDHGACLTVFAASWFAHHNAQGGVTCAAGTTGLISPELLSGFVVEPIVGAATAPNRHTLVNAEDVAIVALAGFHAWLRAERGSLAVSTAGGAGIATKLRVAILRARQGCKEEENSRSLTTDRMC